MSKKLISAILAFALVFAFVPSSAFAYSKVTSWSKSNGKTSFQYHDSTKVKMSGVKAVCIDVSEHNGTINWTKVKKDGVDYAIIRCGFGWDKTRNDRTNGSQEDYQFVTNVKGALKAGVKVGVYLYSYAWDASTAKKEGKFVLKLLKKAGLTTSNMALPVYYDLEEQDGTSKPKVPEKNSSGTVVDHHSISNATLGKMAKAFCGVITDAGYKVGIYANTTWWTKYLTDSAFNNSKWSKWVAQYGKTCTYTKSSYDAWQFTSKGSVSGVGNSTDVSFFFKSFSASSSKYKVTYKIFYGKNNSKNPTKIKTDKSYKLYEPTRAGYKFKGWYWDKKLTKKITKIKSGYTRNIIIYSKWKKRKDTFTVKVTSSDGLIIRSKGSTSGDKVDGLSYKEKVKICKVEDDWGKLSDGRGWIFLKFTKEV